MPLSKRYEKALDYGPLKYKDTGRPLFDPSQAISDVSEAYDKGGLLQAGLAGLGAIAEPADSILGAPYRVALDRLAQGRYVDAAKDALTQLGKDPRGAPTGADIAEKVFPDDQDVGARTTMATIADVSDIGSLIPAYKMSKAAGLLENVPMSGVIKKIDKPLYHGGPNPIASIDEMRPSRGGHAGPGKYFTPKKNVAEGYGEHVLEYTPGETNILDFHGPDAKADLDLAAKDLGIEKELSEILQNRIQSKLPPYFQLKDAFAKKIDPDFKLIGLERDKALVNALKDKGYEGVQYNFNGQPAINLFDKPKELSGAQGILKEIDTPEKALALTPEKREVYLKALDEIYGPKDVRAKDMGFDDKTYYHGTADDIEEFKHEKLGSHTGEGATKDRFWFTDNPQTAGIFSKSAKTAKTVRNYYDLEDKILRYQGELQDKINSVAPDEARKLRKEIKDLDELMAFQSAKKNFLKKDADGNIIPVKLRTKGLKEKDMGGKFWIDSANEVPEGETILNNFRESTPDEGAPLATSIGLESPQKIRSIFAAFDPRFKKSKNIMSGFAPGLLMSGKKDDE